MEDFEVGVGGVVCSEDAWLSLTRLTQDGTLTQCFHLEGGSKRVSKGRESEKERERRRKEEGEAGQTYTQVRNRDISCI